MNNLISIVEQMMKINNDWKKLYEVTTNYIETLSVSSSDEIHEMLQYVDKHYFLEFPYWARLIAFRILVLMKPNDLKIKHWVTSVLGVFGDPKRDKEIEKWWLDN